MLLNVMFVVFGVLGGAKALFAGNLFMYVCSSLVLLEGLYEAQRDIFFNKVHYKLIK